MRTKRAQATMTILREDGPLAIEELGRRLALIGATKARDPARAALDVVRYEHRVIQLMDGRWLDRVAALDGAMLLHRVSGLERWRAAIRMDPDLSVLSSLVTSPSVWWNAALPGMASLGWVRDRRLDRRHAAPDRFLAVPYGLTRELAAGDMIRVVVGEGSLTFEPVPGWRDPGDVAYPEVEAVARTLLDDAPDDDDGLAGPVGIDRLLFELLGRAPDALRSLREPVGAMLHRAGLATHRELIGTSTIDWDRFERSEAAVEWAFREAWEAERPRRDHEPPPESGPGPDDWVDDPFVESSLLDQVSWPT